MALVETITLDLLAVAIFLCFLTAVYLMFVVATQLWQGWRMGRRSPAVKTVKVVGAEPYVEPGPHAWPERRAEALLLSLLDAEQRRSYKLTGRFVVTTPSGHQFLLGQQYLMAIRVNGNAGGYLGGGYLGFYPIGIALPVQDYLIAQLLWLRHDEQAVRRIACGRG